MGAKLNAKKIEKVVNLYADGLSTDAIGKLIGSKGQTVAKYLKIAGIEIRGPKTKLTKEDRLEIGKLYQSGLSTPKIAEKYNVSNGIILRYLKQQNIQSRTPEEAHRKYAINEDFFDIIDSEEKAYFLGFLYADGCNHKDANYVSLGLKQTDKEILAKLASLIYKENPESHIKIQDRTHEGKGVTSYFTINSKHICTQLEKLGCVPAKTFKLEYPTWMPEYLHRHFIRGYFDGDGGLNINTKKGQGSTIKLTSTLLFSTKIKEILENKLNVHMCIWKATNSEVYDVYTSGNRQIRNILEWMYKDATIYMKRKYDLYLKLIKEIEKTNELIIAGTRGYQKRYLNK